jgi:hypothetical protein
MLAALISPAKANTSRRAGDAAVSWANWQCGGAEVETGGEQGPDNGVAHIIAEPICLGTIGDVHRHREFLRGSADRNSNVQVTFKKGATTLGTATLSGGVATFTISSLPAGSSTITANYGGTPNYSASSASVTQVVQ